MVIPRTTRIASRLVLGKETPDVAVSNTVTTSLTGWHHAIVDDLSFLAVSVSANGLAESPGLWHWHNSQGGGYSQSTSHPIYPQGARTVGPARRGILSRP
jgi:hypothetical protein